MNYPIKSQGHAVLLLFNSARVKKEEQFIFFRIIPQANIFLRLLSFPKGLTSSITCTVLITKVHQPDGYSAALEFMDPQDLLGH